MFAFVLTFGGCGRGNSGSSESRKQYAGSFFVEERESIHHKFVVRNSKDHTVTVNNIMKSCNCTDVSLDKKVLAPGQSGDMLVKVNLSRQLGLWRVVCTLETDDADEPNWSYELTYKTYPHVRFIDSNVDLGLIASEGSNAKADRRTATTLFEVYEPAANASRQDVEFEVASPVLLSRTDPPKVDLLDNKTIRRTSYLLSISYDNHGSTQPDVGRQSTLLTGKASSLGVATMPVSWMYSVPCEVSPQPLSFGMIRDLRDSAHRIITVKSQDKIPFNIVNLEDIDRQTGGVIHAKMLFQGDQKPPRSLHQIDISAHIKSQKLKYIHGSFNILTDSPAFPCLNVHWSAILADQLR
jgi:hypothetical protein